MTRRKVTLAYLSKDADRKASYRKRVKGLMKKVHELSIMCDVEACAIIYGEDDKEPEVWPSREEAQQMLENYERLSKAGRTKRMANPEGVSQECAKKAQTQLERLQKENMRKKLELFLYRVIVEEASLQEFDMTRPSEMIPVIQQIYCDVNAKIKELQGNDGHININVALDNTNAANNETAPGHGNI